MNTMMEKNLTNAIMYMEDFIYELSQDAPEAGIICDAGAVDELEKALEHMKFKLKLCKEFSNASK